MVLKLAVIAFFLPSARSAQPVSGPVRTERLPQHLVGGGDHLLHIGFDAVSTAAGEAEPQRDVPIGIIASLVVCTIIYIVVALVLTGMLPWKLGTAEPLATAFSALGCAGGRHPRWRVFATTSVLVVFRRTYASSSRWRATAYCRPGRQSTEYARAHQTILTSTFVAVFASYANIDEIVG
jgi:APA family basic amino acid/polyamine antiporter